MIDLKIGTLTLDGRTEQIRHYKVYFVAVDGLHSNLADALADCERNGIEPNMIRPVPVAIDLSGRYEMFMR